MSDISGHQPKRVEVGPVERLIEGVSPMGDLGQFLIDDLTAEEKETFYRVLEEA